MSLWIELVFCMLTVMQKFLVKPTSHCISLTFKCSVYSRCTRWTLCSRQKGPMKQGLSFLLSCCPSSCFIGTESSDFSEFWNGAQKSLPLYTLMCMTEPDFFGKTFFTLKIGEMDQKQGFLNSKKNLIINFHWICSIMKIYVICCVPAQILHMEKILFLRYRPRSSQPITLQDF